MWLSPGWLGPRRLEPALDAEEFAMIFFPLFFFFLGGGGGVGFKFRV